MAQWLLEQLLRERATIQQAPILFLTAVVAAAAVAFILVRWTFTERLKAANELIGLYRDRYGTMATVAKSPLAQLRNSALRARAVALVDKMHEIARQGREDTLGLDLTEPFEQRTARLLGLSNTFKSRYESECRSQAIALRTEIEERLNSLHIQRPQSSRPAAFPFQYEYPTNPIGLEIVASDLHQIADLLP